ncbi:MAG: hypothetical protein AAFP77_24800 [Bacteroidota bacterium]
MKQLTLLSVALLWAMPSFTQTCDTLICSEGFAYTLYPTEGECLWPIPATDFPNSPSWRFIPTNYSFPVPANPWHETFPELIEIEAISDGLIEVDFIGIKMGDVNNSVITN